MLPLVRFHQRRPERPNGEASGDSFSHFLGSFHGRSPRLWRDEHPMFANIRATNKTRRMRAGKAECFRSSDPRKHVLVKWGR